MELANVILGAVSTVFLAVFGYLAHHFVSSLRREIRELKEENLKQGEILFQLEVDLNEAWFLVRRLTGKGGGRRKVRLTKAWRRSGYASNAWTTCSGKDFGESAAEDDDLR